MNTSRSLTSTLTKIYFSHSRKERERERDLFCARGQRRYLRRAFSVQRVVSADGVALVGHRVRMFNVIDGLDSGNGRQVSVIHHLVLHFSLEMRMALMGGGESRRTAKSQSCHSSSTALVLFNAAIPVARHLEIFEAAGRVMGGARKDFQTWGLFLLVPRSSFFHRELTLTPPRLISRQAARFTLRPSRSPPLSLQSGCHTLDPSQQRRL